MELIGKVLKREECFVYSEEKERYFSDMIERFDQNPRPIQVFLDEVKIDPDLRDELEKLLEAHLLLKGIGKALRKITPRARFIQ